MTRLVSGVQPTGNLHLGNYLGAIKNWALLQDSFDQSLFGIMDMHAITVAQKPQKLNKATLQTLATLIACGIDPKKNIIFSQSSVLQHAELSWILSCHTPMGWLNRMTQFKDKTGNNQQNAVLGLYAYPVLMAADILAYKATHVPVGEDQTQHIQLARDIAGAFNRNYSKDYFVLPEAQIAPETARIMSLRDGTKKMSKSDISDYSRINLTDTADMISDKIRKAKSDSIIGITFEENRPEANNLLSIYAALQGLTKDQAEADGSTLNFSEFKKQLIDVLVEHLAPISKEIQRLMNEKNYLDSILLDGKIQAGNIAAETLKEVKDIVGFAKF